MIYYIVKTAVTAVLIVSISEVAKRSSLMGAILASLPLTSILAMTWLYAGTKDPEKIIALSSGIFWLILPSLTLFVVLPILLKYGVNFYLSTIISMGVTAGCYWGMVNVLNSLGIRL